jgi:SAM-dependent methyltransferase
MSEERRARALELASRALERDDPTGWFEELYAEAADEEAIPWQRESPHPLLAAWLERRPAVIPGRRAAVVGCGLGEDAEALAATGYAVTAFDLSASAIEWCRRRHPESPVEYRVADLLDLPAEWARAFDLVVECLTLQALPGPVRARTFAPLAGLVAPGGELFVVARAREEGAPDEGPPWALTRGELEALVEAGLTEEELASVETGCTPPGPRWRGVFRRPEG